MQVACLQGQLARLERELDAKQAAMLSMSQHSALKQAYNQQLHTLQQERDELQRERLDLLQKLESLQAASGVRRQGPAGMRPCCTGGACALRHMRARVCCEQRAFVSYRVKCATNPLLCNLHAGPTVNATPSRDCC